mmetsp:Transcript_19154/g.45987  ORF Transcript_19154/g.45987 Transcript_19154/m.45987 type:complete len:160 (+) Transcript_19154:95-574(+)
MSNVHPYTHRVQAPTNAAKKALNRDAYEHKIQSGGWGEYTPAPLPGSQHACHWALARFEFCAAREECALRSASACLFPRHSHSGARMHPQPKDRSAQYCATTPAKATTLHSSTEDASTFAKADIAAPTRARRSVQMDRPSTQVKAARWRGEKECCAHRP